MSGLRVLMAVGFVATLAACGPLVVGGKGENAPEDGAGAPAADASASGAPVAASGVAAPVDAAGGKPGGEAPAPSKP